MTGPYIAALAESSDKHARPAAKHLKLPLRLTCKDPEAGATVAEQDTLAKERAEAQSEAEGGVEVPYEVTYEGEADVEADALAKDEIDFLEKQEKQAQLNLGG